MSSRRKPPSSGKLPWGNIGTAPRQRQSAFGKLDWVHRTGHPPGSAPCSHPRVIDRSVLSTLGPFHGKPGEAALLGLAPCGLCCFLIGTEMQERLYENGSCAQKSCATLGFTSRFSAQLKAELVARLARKRYQ